MRWCGIVFVLFLFGCEPEGFVGVEKIREENIDKPLRYEFLSDGNSGDVDFVFRYDEDFVGDVLPIEVRVVFEGGWYYSERVVLKLRKEGRCLGKRKGGEYDLEINWRKGVKFLGVSDSLSRSGVNGIGEKEVVIDVRPCCGVLDWSGVKYFGVRVSNGALMHKDDNIER